MSMAGPALRRAIAGLLIAVIAAPATAADPITLILLRLLRDQIVTSAASRAIDSATDDKNTRTALAPPPTKPGRPFGMDDAQLRRLIDEGFVHLLPPQRDEVFASVKRIIDDPKNTTFTMREP